MSVDWRSTFPRAKMLFSRLRMAVTIKNRETFLFASIWVRDKPAYQWQLLSPVLWLSAKKNKVKSAKIRISGRVPKSFANFMGEVICIVSSKLLERYLQYIRACLLYRNSYSKIAFTWKNVSFWDWYVSSLHTFISAFMRIISFENLITIMFNNNMSLCLNVT